MGTFERPRWVPGGAGAGCERWAQGASHEGTGRTVSRMARPPGLATVEGFAAAARGAGGPGWIPAAGQLVSIKPS